MDQINVIRDTSDYLWYTTSVCKWVLSKPDTEVSSSDFFFSGLMNEAKRTQTTSLVLARQQSFDSLTSPDEYNFKGLWLRLVHGGVGQASPVGYRVFVTGLITFSCFMVRYEVILGARS